MNMRLANLQKGCDDVKGMFQTFKRRSTMKIEANEVLSAIMCIRYSVPHKVLDEFKSKQAALAVR